MDVRKRQLEELDKRRKRIVYRMNQKPEIKYYTQSTNNESINNDKAVIDSINFVNKNKIESGNNPYFTILITGYNSKEWCRRCFESVCSQNYKYFEIIYIDAQSTDGSWDIACEYARKFSYFTIFRNNIRQYQVENILQGVKMTRNKTIIVSADSDDWFPDNEVLSRLSKYYTDNIWMTYGTFAEYPGMKSSLHNFGPYPEGVIRDNNFRGSRWQGSHLRTWRKELFLKINEDDLKDLDGDYFKMAGDIAFMFPMLEMAGEHAKHILEVMYVYNLTNPLTETKVNRDNVYRIEKLVRTRKVYQRLVSL